MLDIVRDVKSDLVRSAIQTLKGTHRVMESGGGCCDHTNGLAERCATLPLSGVVSKKGGNAFGATEAAPGLNLQLKYG